MSDTQKVLKRVRVYHSHYGCETGCCGHTIEIEGEPDQFEFDHPYNDATNLDYAKRLVTERYGAEHAADLDWEHAEVDEVSSNC